jgi:hypothetical protein
MPPRPTDKENNACPMAAWIMVNRPCCATGSATLGININLIPSIAPGSVTERTIRMRIKTNRRGSEILPTFSTPP